MSWTWASIGQRSSARFLNVFDKERVEIDGRDMFDFLPHHARAESVRTADLQHFGKAAEHLGDELVSGEQKAEPLGVVVPDLIAHQAEARAGPSRGGRRNRLRIAVRGFEALYCSFEYLDPIVTVHAYLLPADPIIARPAIAPQCACRRWPG